MFRTGDMDRKTANSEWGHFGHVQSQNSFLPQTESLIAQNWPKRFSLNFVSTLSTPFKVFLQNLKKFLCPGAEI